jgi:hypothetical protein
MLMIARVAAVGHGGSDLCDQDVRRSDVDREHRIEIIVGQLVGRRHGIDAGVVDKQVNATAEPRCGVSREGAKPGVGASEIRF